MNFKVLLEAGLTLWESKAYIALLELGSTTTGPLAKKSGVPQSKIYEVLNSLNNKGLASYIIKGKTKYFQASEPKKILALFKEKERKIKKLIPELESKRQLAKERQSVELFEGLKAIRSILIELISDVKKGENWYGFSTGETSLINEISGFYEWWGTRKYFEGLKDHLLISLDNKREFEKSFKEETLKAIRKITRYSKISFPGDVAIFRDKVIIFNWKDNLTAILITSKNLAEQYKNFFLGLWKIAKK